MIEFTAQTDIDTVQTVLVEVGNSSQFVIKPDRFIKSNATYKKFVLLSGGTDQEATIEHGTVELTRKRDGQVSIKINTSSQASGDLPLAMVDRFFYLLTQRLLQQKLVSVESPRGAGG